MKKKLLILAIMMTSLTFYAQNVVDADTLWKFSGTTSLNLSQLSLTNWAAGGDNSLSGNALIDLSASLLTQPIYDYDIKFGEDTTGDGEYDTFSEKVQFKELFGLGLTYSF